MLQKYLQGMKKSSKVCIILFYLLINSLSFLSSQTIVDPIKSDGFRLFPYLSYGADIPFGDMSDRFGNNLAVQGGVDIVFNNNFTFGLVANYKFGRNVNEDVIASLRLENGHILGTSGIYAEVFLKERGLFLGTRFGKLFPLSWYENHFEFKVDIGGGYFNHFIAIQNSEKDVPQLKGDLIKGYDRNTNGFAINESIALHYISKKDWRIFLSLESIQGFTNPVRALQYDTGLHNTDSRLDVLIGIQIGFIMPFSFGFKGEDIYY